MNVQVGVSVLEISDTVARYTMAEGQILSARRCADRVGLHEAERIEGALQRGRRKQAARDGGAPDVVKSH
jgi:hypothetical protein